MARHTPRSTYRLQLTPQFGFADAEAILPYLHQLGVDWIYCSPVTQAGEGSSHGYDVTDPTKIDAARGGREAFESMCRAAHELGMGVLVDIVPNHQGVEDALANPMWRSLLAEGKGSLHDATFDVDWDAGEGKILLPVIGDDDMPREPGAPIANLRVDGDVLWYHDRGFPLAAGTADDGADTATVHERQHYRLVHWRQADHALNYRRFFTITSLAGVRVEQPEVFERTHSEILRWVREGLVDGLRIDHIDGLRDPAGYLARLREAAPDIYLVVEKILAEGETLPEDWPVDGTTGYEAISLIDRMLVDPHAEACLGELAERAAARAGGADHPASGFGDLAHQMKRDVASGQLRAEIHRITRELVRSGIDHPQIVDAVIELVTFLPVYRSYLPHGRELVEGAAEAARASRPDLAEAINVILPPLLDPTHPAAGRLEQTSGMVMAKGVEDRAFFRDARLTSLNEVGGDPAHFSLSLDELHSAFAEREAREPLAMSALSTHDTKRGEDTRARIHVLAECPELWEDTLENVSDAVPMYAHATGNLVWQAVIGAWPASRERLYRFAEKAAREAGQVTSWTKQNPEAEARIHAAVDAAFDHPAIGSFVRNLVDELRGDGWTNALSAKLVQLTMPGIPDVYQGTELWSFTLTDPDNRDKVDYRSRRSALAALLEGHRPDIDDSGAAKLFVTAAALLTRRERPQLFTGYEAMYAQGTASEHLIAFNRGGAITLATRLPRDLREGGGWGDTAIELREGVWVDQLTARAFDGGRMHKIEQLLSDYPVALLAQSTRRDDTAA